MIRPEYRKALEDQQQVLVLLWVFFLSAIFIYLWLTEVVLGRSGFSAGSSFAEITRVVCGCWRLSNWVLLFGGEDAFFPRRRSWRERRNTSSFKSCKSTRLRWKSGPRRLSLRTLQARSSPSPS